jgi:hypothetical protein
MSRRPQTPNTARHATAKRRSSRCRERCKKLENMDIERLLKTLNINKKDKPPF